MKYDQDPVVPPPETPGDVEFVASLLRTAGTRADPPQAEYEQVLAAASQALEAMLARRRRVRVTLPLALAATLAAVTAGLLWITRPVPSGESVAIPERLAGSVMMRAANGTAWATIALSEPVPAASSIRTGVDSRIGLRLRTGSALRLDADSEVLIESEDRVRLLRGAAYVDSGVERDREGLMERRAVQIVAANVTARDIGTQFEVRLLGGDCRLRVREGRVALAHPGGAETGSAGDQLVIEANGAVERSRVAPDDPGWQWVEQVAAAPDIENQPLNRVLEWVARETGRPIRFSTREIERQAAGAVLHGSIRGLDPLAALATVLATSGLRYQIIEDGSILISEA
jgi:ferric-dicitrate binding protein FerR (iron transport regulator)